MVDVGIKQTLPLIVSFSYITQITNFYFLNLIKQLNPLLFLLFTLISVSSFPLFSKQTVPFESTTNIYSIVQDKKDFIWLAGQNGLYRFDGSQVINFSNHKKDWPIPFNWINNLSIKGEQLILATETQGLSLFNTNTGITTPVNLKMKSKTIYNAIHHKNSFYAISMAPQHLYHHDISTGETKILIENIQNDILVSTNNRIYFNNNEKLYFINSIDHDLTLQHIKGINTRIVAVTSTEDKAILASKNHLFKITDTGAITKEKIFSPISAIAISNNNQSLFTIDLSGSIIERELKNLEKHDNTFPSVEGLIYQALLHDSSGVLWLVSNRGIQLLTENTVKNHSAVFNTKYSLLETAIYDDQLYIGSYGEGVHTLSPFKDSQVHTVKNINSQLPSNAQRITDLLTVKKTLFIASFDGLWKYNKKNQQTHKVDLTFKNNNFSHLILLKLVSLNDLLYIATDGKGLIVYDIKKKRIIKHIDTTAGLSSGEVIDILPLDNGDIWLATASGIDTIRKHTNRVDTITSQTKAKFMSLLQAGGKIFATTKGDGIFVYNQHGQLLNHFAKGINFSYMSLIGNHIFASAKPGVYKIDPTNYQSTMISSTEPFSFTDNAVRFNDSLYIANSLGILELPKLAESTFHPKTYISKTTVSGLSLIHI